MSNIYTQFSTRIPWDGPARAALLTQLHTPKDPDNPSPPCDFAEQPDGIWLYSEDNCDLDALVATLAEVQSTFHLPPLGFEFSISSCGKPVLDEFGGGAVIITNGEATWLSTSTWLAEQLAAAAALPVCLSP